MNFGLIYELFLGTYQDSTFLGYTSFSEVRPTAWDRIRNANRALGNRARRLFRLPRSASHRHTSRENLVWTENSANEILSGESGGEGPIVRNTDEQKPENLENPESQDSVDTTVDSTPNKE